MLDLGLYHPSVVRDLFLISVMKITSVGRTQNFPTGCILMRGLLGYQHGGRIEK